MHYYIDGYNLLFRNLLKGKDLASQRHAMILFLEEKAQLLKLDLTIVFDSQYRTDGKSRGHYKSVEICFTAFDETADNFILSKLREIKNPKQQIVVTSDRQLRLFCRHEQAETMTAEAFMLLLSKVKNKSQKEEELVLETKAIQLRPLIGLKNKQPLQKSDPSIVPELDILKNPKASFVDCFNVYLETFEKNVPEYKVQQKQIKKQAKKSKIKEAKTQDPLESDEQRWLRAFENKIKSESNS